MGADTPVDVIVKSFNDIRVGSSFATADLVAMHPTTWTDIRTQKNTQGSYLLTLNTPHDIGDIDNIFGVKVITNSKVPAETAITFGTSLAVLAWTRLGLEIVSNQFGSTEWTTNAWSFRAEERVAIGVQRPTAICVVTGLPAT